MPEIYDTVYLIVAGKKTYLSSRSPIKLRAYKKSSIKTRTDAFSWKDTEPKGINHEMLSNKNKSHPSDKRSISQFYRVSKFFFYLRPLAAQFNAPAAARSHRRSLEMISGDKQFESVNTIRVACFRP